MQFEETDEKNEAPAFVKEFLDSNLFQVSKTKYIEIQKETQCFIYRLKIM
jgi:hypothetical protein